MPPGGGREVIMYTEKDNLAFIWRETGNGAEILRVYSDMPDVCIPE